MSEFTSRLQEALSALRGPGGGAICRQALQHIRRIADIDTIVRHTRY